jgi:hypothetical protein
MKHGMVHVADMGKLEMYTKVWLEHLMGREKSGDLVVNGSKKNEMDIVQIGSE